jgi:hypothetical protein
MFFTDHVAPYFNGNPGGLSPTGFAGGTIRLQTNETPTTAGTPGTSGLSSFTSGLLQGAGNFANGFLTNLGRQQQAQAEVVNPGITQPVAAGGIGGLILLGIVGVAAFALLSD